MRKFTNVNCEHLATFQSEKIGIQHYYFCTMEMDERTIRYTIMLDADDILSALDQESFTDEEREEVAESFALCNAEVLASLPSMEEVLQVADKWIGEYNNGSRFEIADNADIDTMATIVKDNIDETDIYWAKQACKDEQTPMYHLRPSLYDQIDELVQHYCDDENVFCVDTNEVIKLL